VVTGRRHRPPDTREPSPYVEAPVPVTSPDDAADDPVEDAEAAPEPDVEATDPSQTPPE
jgi:hypothetical protein